MNRIFRHMLTALLCALLLSALTVAASAEETPQARELTSKRLLTGHYAALNTGRLFDTGEYSSCILRRGGWLTFGAEEPMGSLYLIFNTQYGPYTVTNNDTGESITAGEDGYLHDFLDLKALFGSSVQSVTLTFDNPETKLNEVRAFTEGRVPSDVQIWQSPRDGETDLVLFSTHGDDEQLFFAGLLPYYAKERGYQVQVVYLTNHRNQTYRRAHEMLNGLWAVGVDTYPVFGTFYDLMSSSRELAMRNFRSQGVTEEDLLGFVVENLRRFRPMVAVGHDLEGEYGHGQHMVYADMLIRAVEITNDPQQFPESAEQYGVWDVPKTYLHLYPRNQIYLDWDQPLESFGGMTAFEVTKKLGYPCHKSQYWDFAWYLAYKNSAGEITEYSPCEYGLYRSTVGEDVLKNDIFENVKTHVQVKAEEEAARIAAEEEDRRQEEERLEAERKAEEERIRREEAQRRAEEAEQERLRLEEEAATREAQRRKQLTVRVLAGVLLVLLLLGTVIAVIDRRREKYFEKK